MEVYFEGEKLPEKVEKEISGAAEFFGWILMDSRMADNIILTIDVRDTMQDDGACFPDIPVKRPREFTIEMRKGVDYIRVLAHEMVHLKQFAKGEIRGLSATEELWIGKKVKFTKKQHRYFDAPWELEAFGKEVGLYHRWKEHSDKS